MSRSQRLQGPLLVSLMLISLAAPLAAAAPSPGAPEVDNNICSTWNSTAGICDDWDHLDDPSPNAQEAFEGDYSITMANATVLNIDLRWAIHEFNRSDLGLEDMPIGNGSDPARDGIPADYMRNYFGHWTPYGMTVQELLRQEIEDTVTALIDNGFGATSSVVTTYEDEVELDGQTLTCEDDPDQDSVDEVLGIQENAYHPPICIQTVASVIIDTSALGLAGVDFDIERAYQGILTMGAEVETGFNITAKPGHVTTYNFHPPGYGELTNASGPLATLTEETSATYPYHWAHWKVDHSNASQTDPWLNESVSVTMARRATTTQAVELDLANETGIQLSLLLDARDPRATTVEVGVDVHHIGMDLLGESEFTLGGATLPWVTSDGLRLAHHSGLADMDDFTAALPMDEIAQSLSDLTGTTVTLAPPNFDAPDASGGLEFMHGPATCAESDASPWCIQGATAMNGTYPVRMSTSTSALDLSVENVLANMVSDERAEAAGLDLSILQTDDVIALLNAAQINSSFDPDVILDYLPEDLPPMDIEFTMLLPLWIQNAEGVGDRISFTITAGYETPPIALGITGTDPYDWSHNICESRADCTTDAPDLICTAAEQTCIHVAIDVDVSAFDVHEFSQTVEVRAGMVLRLSVYRIGTGMDFLEEDQLDMPVIPADLIRHLVDLGERADGELIDATENLTVPIGEREVPISLSRTGLNEFANRVSVIMEDEINTALLDLELSDEGFPIEVRAGRMDVEAQILNLEAPTTTSLDDRTPIIFEVELKPTSLEIQLTGEGLDTSQLGVGMATTGLLQAGVGMVATPRISGAQSTLEGVEVPPGEKITMEVPAMGQEVEGALVKPAVTFSITFPLGIGFKEFTSSSGREVISEEDGRQTLTYRLVRCTADTAEGCAAQTDTVSFQFVIGTDYFLSQLWMYLILPILFLLLLIARRIKRGGKRSKGKRGRKPSDRWDEFMLDPAEDPYQPLPGQDLPSMSSLVGGSDAHDMTGYEDLLAHDER